MRFITNSFLLIGYSTRRAIGAPGAAADALSPDSGRAQAASYPGRSGVPSSGAGCRVAGAIASLRRLRGGLTATDAAKRAASAKAIPAPEPEPD
jgi:hypothetical protein